MQVKFNASEIAKSGLPRSNGPRQKVLIIGAGMAGLSAAYELEKAGHEPILLEARQRAGGRVQTIREPWAEGLHAEVGAMRIPETHDLTWHYIRHFGLKTMPFTMGNPNAYYFIAGKKIRIQEYRANPAILGFDLAPQERGQTVQQLWANAIQPLVDRVKREGDKAWQQIVHEYDNFSTREFLEEKCKWSEGAIELYGLLENQEAEMNYSFIELVREEVGEYYSNLHQIVGGTDRLPQAFFEKLKARIRFGAEVTALEQKLDGVIAHCRSHAGRFSVEADAMIVTVPFSVLRHIEASPAFSHQKQKAIRELHYDASTKICLQCRHRFWEEKDGIIGGGTITDLPIRNLYYPEHGRDTGRGVLLASYTWAEDAQRWGSLSPRDRIEQAVEDVSKIHPEILDEYEAGASLAWHDDPYAGGAFALFEPGQQSRLYATIIAPEGRIHFAGEHASLAHAWIQGALESGLRTAWEVSEGK